MIESGNLFPLGDRDVILCIIIHIVVRIVVQVTALTELITKVNKTCITIKFRNNIYIKYQFFFMKLFYH